MKRRSSSERDDADDASGEKPTHRTAESDDAQLEREAFLLVVVEGPDSGASHVIDAVSSPSRVLIGTSPTCDFRLRDREISRRHASVRVDDDAKRGRQLLIADLSSTNGTSVNGVSLREAALRGGEVIRIGQTVISVARSATVADHPLHATRDPSFGRLLGESLAMRKLYPLLHRAAASDHTLLLEGEAGVGKELCAEEIHAHSERRSVRPLVTLAANAVPVDEIEARLFGEEDGLVTHASGGTIFIDEIASLPQKAQKRLLDVLSAAKTEESPRFIVATRRDLDRDVVEGRFEERLLAVLAKGRIELPPLRERIGDVALLAKTFWETLQKEEPQADSETPKLPNDFLPRFENYPWPGNVRELLAAVRARLTLGELAPWRSSASATDNAAARENDLIANVIDRELPLGEARKIVIDDFERRYVAYMMARFGNTRDAARASGVALRYLQLLRARFL